MDKIQELQSAISDIRDSINNKNISLGADEGFKVYPDAVNFINRIKDEGLSSTIHGVNYYDYDGTLLYVYTPQEFLALTTHPSQPTHTGLLADGWNWSLTDAQDFVENTCDCLNIGAHYITDNGETRLYISFAEEYKDDAKVGIYYVQSIANGLTIDWGDGNTEVTGTNTSVNQANIWHTYAQAGNYVIRIMPADNCIFTLGNDASYNGVFGYTYTTQRWNYQNLYKAELGKNVAFNHGNGFRDSCRIETISVPSTIHSTEINPYYFVCDNLKAIVIPNGITTISTNNVFADTRGCNVLLPSSVTSLGINGNPYMFADSIIFPNGVTTIDGQACRYAKCARRIFIPDSITTLPNYALAATYNLEELHLPNNQDFTTIPQYFLQSSHLRTVDIPTSITTINASAFASQYIYNVILRPTVPPTLANKNAFTTASEYLKIYVPYSSDHSILNAYKTAEVWVDVASNIYELDENGNIPSE